MNLIELGSVLGDFFEGGAGPSHDELDRAIARVGLGAGDPGPGGRGKAGPVGKTKRIRQVLVYATDNDANAGVALGRQLVDLFRADGMFEPSLETYAGDHNVGRLRDAFDRQGFVLDQTGALRPRVIDNLEGTALTEALRTLVSRINVNPDDPALQVGSGKELDEAAARHVLKERLGDYPVGGHAGSFAVTLAHAFNVLGLEVAPDLKSQLSADPHRQVHQCLFLLGRRRQPPKERGRHGARTSRWAAQHGRTLDGRGSPWLHEHQPSWLAYSWTNSDRGDPRSDAAARRIAVARAVSGGSADALWGEVDEPRQFAGPEHRSSRDNG